MNKLQQAYIDLGLQPGAPLEQVVERWRVIARMWHPDRAATEQERTIAEAELKKVNGARDLISRHYQDGLHRLVGCECSAEPVQDPRGSMYEGTQRTSDRPPPSGAGGGNATGQTRANGAASGGAQRANAPAGTRMPRRRQQQSPSIVASMITGGMVLLAMSIVKLNTGVKIEHRPTDSFSNDSAAVQSWRAQQDAAERGGDVSQSTLASLRPSLANRAATADGGTSAQEKSDTDKAQTDAEAAKAKAREQDALTAGAANKSAVEFVSADGRLISLQDGTTWELWPQEPADSMFAWQPKDRITVKGKQASMSWLVNDSRSHQAVKVTRVE